MQVSQLQRANGELHKIFESITAKTTHTSVASSETIPEPSTVPTQHVCTSNSTDEIDPELDVAIVNSIVAKSNNLLEASVGSSMNAVTVQKDGSGKEDVLKGVRAVQDELMKSVLQQMEALANQHICLQVGQVCCTTF